MTDLVICSHSRVGKPPPNISMKNMYQGCVYYSAVCHYRLLLANDCDVSLEWSDKEVSIMGHNPCFNGEIRKCYHIMQIKKGISLPKTNPKIKICFTSKFVPQCQIPKSLAQYNPYCAKSTLDIMVQVR